MIVNAWGNEIPIIEDPEDTYYVPPEERLDHDLADDAVALLDPDTGVISTDEDDG